MKDRLYTINFKDVKFTIYSKDEIDSKVAYSLALLHHLQNPDVKGAYNIATTSSAAEDILQQFAELLQNQEEQ